MNPDLDTSIGFLRFLRPNGPVNLTAIVPNGQIHSATFSEPESARAWIGKHVDKASIYFSVNPAAKPTGSGGRVNRQSLDRIEYVHVDIDVDKDGRSKDAVADALDASIVIDSGGGLAALWRLDEPLPVTQENIEWAEGANRWLVEEHGGDRNSADASRLLRLPGTINFPDDRKKARGRTVVPTRLLSQNGEVHPRSKFGQAARQATSSTADKDLDTSLIEEVDDLDALVEKYGLDERTRSIILDGRAPGEEKLEDDSRDKWMFDGCCQMARAGVPVGVIAGVLLNSNWAISGHVLDHKGRPTEVYAMRQAIRAEAHVKADQKEDLDFLSVAEQVSDGEWPEWFRQNWAPIGQRDIATIPPTPWLVEGLLLYGDVTTIGGRGGSGKSLLGWQIVVSIATGTPLAWWRAPTQSRKVLVISGEDDVNEIERRVSAACQAMNLKRSDLGENFMVWTARNIRLAVKDSKAGTVKKTKLWQGIRWAVENLDVGLVVMDPLVKVSSGFDESSNDDMDQLYAIIRELTVGHECAALNIDHFAKGGTGGDQASIRGASAKVDAARVAITLTGMTEAEFEKLRPPHPREAYALCVDAKQNYAKKSGGHWLEFIDYPVGNGEIRPSLVWRDLDAGEFVDPQRWQHRGAFLRMVAKGRADGQPWSASNKGPRDARLLPAMAQAFGLTEKQAGVWVQAFAAEGSIRIVEQKRSNRTTAWVWEYNRDYQTEEDIETEVIRG